jgi:hypothetical protein
VQGGEGGRGGAIPSVSGAHYIEMYNIKDPRQRRDVAAVMEELMSSSSSSHWPPRPPRRSRQPSPSARWTASATSARCAVSPSRARRHRGAQTPDMTRLDPLAAGAEAKRTAMLVRDARAVLRRLDVLASVVIAAADPAILLIAAGARDRGASGDPARPPRPGAAAPAWLAAEGGRGGSL